MGVGPGVTVPGAAVGWGVDGVGRGDGDADPAGVAVRGMVDVSEGVGAARVGVREGVGEGMVEV